MAVALIAAAPRGGAKANSRKLVGRSETSRIVGIVR